MLGGFQPSSDSAPEARQKLAQPREGWVRDT